MIEIIFYGRGGQGAVVASKMLAWALFKEGRYVQSFPAFGGERRGAPVKAFLRADQKRVRRRSLIYRADHAIVMDDTLIEEIPLAEEVKEARSIVINSSKAPAAFQGLLNVSRIGTVDADAIAAEQGLGTEVMPIVNTTMLGAFARISKLVNIESVADSIRKYLEARAEENVEGAMKAYEGVIEGS